MKTGTSQQLFNALVNVLNRLLGYDIKTAINESNENNRFHGSINKLKLFEDFSKASILMDAGIPSQALKQLKSIVFETFSNVAKDLSSDLSKFDLIANSIDVLKSIVPKVDEQVKDNEQKLFANICQTFNTFTTLENDSENIVSKCADIVVEFLSFKFKWFVLNGTTNILPIVENWNFSNTIILTSHPEPILNKVLRDKAIQNTIIPVFVKTENVGNSYFMFLFKHKDDIFICTDCKFFENIAMIDASRNPMRRIENANHHLYKWYENMLEIGSSSSSLINSKLPAFFLPISKTGNTEYEQMIVEMYFFIQQMIVHGNKQVEPISTFATIANQKLIGCIENNLDIDNSFSKCNIEQCSEHLKNCKYDFIQDNRFELATISTEISTIVDKSPIKQYLVTPGIIKSIVAHNLLVTKANRIKEHLESKMDTDLKELISKLSDFNNQHLISVLKDYIMQFKSISISYAGQKHLGLESKYTSLPTYCNSTPNESRYPYLIVQFEEKLLDFVEYSFNIYSYKDLMFLLGCDRDSLPVNFRNYAGHYFLPYYGNPILDNINPLFIQSCNEPFQKKWPNGCTILFRMSKDLKQSFIGNKYRKPSCWIDCDENANIKEVSFNPPTIEHNMIKKSL